MVAREALPDEDGVEHEKAVISHEVENQCLHDSVIFLPVELNDCRVLDQMLNVAVAINQFVTSQIESAESEKGNEEHGVVEFLPEKSVQADDYGVGSQDLAEKEGVVNEEGKGLDREGRKASFSGCLPDWVEEVVV